jgi:hypothetical protein
MQEEKYTGLDSKVIDLMYFPKAEEKQKYLKDVHELLNNLSIRIGDSRLDVLTKVGDAESDLALLPDVFAFSGDFQFSERSDRNKYYTLVKLCEFNIENKQASSEKNFDFEEQLFQQIISVDLSGYAKLKLNFQLGQLFSDLKLNEKRDFYFNLFRLTRFDISPATVSEFYRSIAEVYLESENSEYALNWLRAGVALNPKLPVKKKIKELENK